MIKVLSMLHEAYVSCWKVVHWLLPLMQARFRYMRTEVRIRKECRSRPIKVLFPMNGTVAKWKMQSLFDLMQKSEYYDPVIALTVFDIDAKGSHADRIASVEKAEKYFSDNGMRYVWAYDVESDKCLPFDPFKPDIVWYQNPWNIADVQNPFSVSRYALTCYVPYFVQNYGALDMDCLSLFHRGLWRHFTLNERWAKVFMASQGRFLRSGAVVGLGHPMLDQFRVVAKKNKEPKPCIIYAPHWSCGVGECYSTFLQYGSKILELAKQYSEVKWVFKPHPSLKFVLEKENFMTKDAIEAYYAGWAKIGLVNEDGEYAELFNNSSALITDCASFLVEFACTTAPIIHLLSKNVKYKPHPISDSLFKTYYQVNDYDEFLYVFNRVVKCGDDYKKNLRLNKIAEMGLDVNCAAQNILKYMCKKFQKRH